MRLLVCETAPELHPGDDDWCRLAAAIRAAAPDLVLLPEMPFGRWVAQDRGRDEAALEESRRLHQLGIACFGELGGAAVLATHPTVEGGRSVNQGFVWEAGAGIMPVHTKQFLPDEDGYYEARWFARGEAHFRIAPVRGVGVGFLICTEVMFNEWARRYGRAGAHLIVVPRVTPRPSLARWKTAVEMAAIVSGCYVASSNRAGVDGRGQEYGGGAWIFDPSGELIAEASAERPFAVAELDLTLADRAKLEYPCYVEELPG